MINVHSSEKENNNNYPLTKSIANVACNKENNNNYPLTKSIANVACIISTERTKFVNLCHLWHPRNK